MLHETLGSQPVYARIPAVVLYAQAEGVEMAGAPASPRPGPFVMNFDRGRIMGTVESSANHTSECSHPAEVALLFVSQIDSDPCEPEERSW